jgi:hypothetical protein
MTEDALYTGTWRRKSSLASWHHRVPRTDGASPIRELCEAAVRAWSIIDGFADVAAAEWTTISTGDEALVETRPTFDPQRIREAFERLGDVTTLDLSLDLRCVGIDRSEGVIPNAGTLLVDLNWPDWEALGTGTPDLDIVLMLDVDIYAPHTGGHHPDNRVLAALNGPRLTAFLRRLRSTLGATLVSVDSYADGGIDADGWVGATEP